MSESAARTPDKRASRAGRGRRLAAALAAAAAVAVPVGIAASPASALPPGGDGPTTPNTCWNEYGFTRIGNTMVASAFKDCVNLNVPQPLKVSIEMYISDEGGSAWHTAASGYGNVQQNCVPGWPTWFRNSISKELIYC